jgi:hypothetical protein
MDHTNCLQVAIKTLQFNNIALAQIFTSKDLSDLYSRWHWKLAQFAGMRIKHRKGRKMYCADSLSRRRPAEADDKEPFFVEPGQLFKLHTPKECGQVAGTLLQYLQEQTDQGQPSEDGRQRLPPISNGWCDLWDPGQWIRHTPGSVTETAQNPAQLMNTSTGYITHTLHSSMMERFRKE